MSRKFLAIHTFISGGAATGAGTALPVRDCSRMVLEIIGDSSANATVKFAGSFPDVSPVWSGSPSDTDKHSLLGFRNMSARTLVDGSTGLTVGANSCNLVEIDTTAIGKLNAIITAISGGTVTVRGFMIDED